MKHFKFPSTSFFEQVTGILAHSSWQFVGSVIVILLNMFFNHTQANMHIFYLSA